MMQSFIFFSTYHKLKQKWVLYHDLCNEWINKDYIIAAERAMLPSRIHVALRPVLASLKGKNLKAGRAILRLDHSAAVADTMSEENRMDTWQERWSEGKIGWHLPDLNFALENHASKLLTKPERRILVPLCGKSVDVAWLYKEGHTVVGIEGIEQAIEEFFSEHSLPYTTEQLAWAKLFKTKDDRLKMYCCDIFKMDMESLGKFDAVFDRGSLVAIYEEDRERYAKVIKALLAPGFHYMINAVQYTPHEGFSGPPRNIPTALVEKLFGDVCELQVLEEKVRPKELVANWGLDCMVEAVLLLTPRL